MDKELFNTRELAQYLDINEKKIYSLILDKGLPATKITGKWLFPKHMVDVWIENHIQNYPWMEGRLKTFNEALIVAGSNDILLANSLSFFRESHRDILPLYSSVGSMEGINAVKKGWCHIGVAHLLQKEDEDYNLAYLKDSFGEEFIIVNFAYRTQGLLLARGNPKNIKTIKDIARTDVTVANRQAGTGTRFLLEYELEKIGINTRNIKGYDHICLTHLDVGIEILTGKADVGLGIQIIAHMLGLDFIPLRKERFDFIIRKAIFFDNNIQSLLTFIRSKDLIDYSKQFIGYDLKDIGTIIY